MQPLREYIVGGFRVSEFSELDSTNNFLKKIASEGEPDGAVAIAVSQTGGKGRLGRSFFSPASGLYMSVLLRRDIPITLAHLLTPMTAVAVAEALEAEGSERAGIKWVNDIYIGGRKVCGILTETQVSQDGKNLVYAVVGIGVNLAEPAGGFPDDIKNRAGAAFKNADENLRERLAGKILLRLEKHLRGLAEKGFLDEYRSRSVLDGREVMLIEPQGETRARVLGVDEECRLVVKTDDGVRAIFSGEVSVRM